MKKNVLFLLLIGWSYLPLTAQFSLSGQLLNETDKPLAYATIAIFTLTDSTLVQGSISDHSGLFSVKNLPSSTYKITIQMLGYQNWEQVLKLTNEVSLGKIILKVTPTTLETIEVVAEQSTVESRLGKKVLHIGQDLSATGSNALEALDNIPSVSTTQKGQVQIRGNNNVIIYINGKETKRDPATLKYISAEVLEKIEVITNPSAKYDAEGVAGIINLVYKKGKKGKFKLETITNLGVLTSPFNLNPSGGLNASLNKAKFSFFTNISLDYGNYESYAISQRKNFMDSLFLYKNKTTLHGDGLTGNYNVGLSLTPDSTLTMGLEVNYDYWDFIENGTQINRFNYLDKTQETVESTNKIEELENELWLNFALEKTFSAKQNLKISLTAGGEDESNFTQSAPLDIVLLPNAAQQFLLSSREREKQRYYQGKVDFTTTFFDFGKLEIGGKADFIDYHILQKVLLHSKTVSLPDNDFTMTMQKLGIYLLQTHQIKKIIYSLGLRMEQFSSNAFQQVDNRTFTQDYLRFFPSIQVNYLLPDNSHTIGFNYTRRINRPGFFALNPFVSFEDPLNLETGNPALRPEIANLFELTYHRGMDKLSWDLTLYQRKTIDAIQENIMAIDNDQTIATSVNIGKQIFQGIEGQLEYRINKWFKTTATFVFNQVQYMDSAFEINFDKSTSWNARLKQQIQLPNQWKIELSENYRAPSYEAQRKAHEQFYMNFGVNKKFNNKRGSISLSIRDIFNTRRYIYSLHTASFEVERSYKWQTRQATLGLRCFLINR